jgi:hypothetical protein
MDVAFSEGERDSNKKVGTSLTYLKKVGELHKKFRDLISKYRG